MHRGKLPRWTPLLILLFVILLVFVMPFVVILTGMLRDQDELVLYGMFHLGLAQSIWWAGRFGRIIGSIYGRSTDGWRF